MLFDLIWYNANMAEDKPGYYYGYPLLNAVSKPDVVARMDERGDELLYFEFKGTGVGTWITVDGIDSGRNPRLRGFFKDSDSDGTAKEFDKFAVVEVLDGGIKPILVPRDKILIG